MQIELELHASLSLPFTTLTLFQNHSHNNGIYSNTIWIQQNNEYSTKYSLLLTENYTSTLPRYSAISCL
jgi:hypothetical protein